MVAVPTVLGIASIHVYPVSDAPADGLAPREKVHWSWSERLAIDVTVASLNKVLSLLLSPVERLQPSAKVCSGSFCSRYTRSDWKCLYCNERECAASGPRRKGTWQRISIPVCIYRSFRFIKHYKLQDHTSSHILCDTCSCEHMRWQR